MAKFILMLLPLAAAALSSDTDTCNPDKMTVYKMVLHTYWTREKFPKHYPDWRPPAQWSKIYGKFFLKQVVTSSSIFLYQSLYSITLYSKQREPQAQETQSLDTPLKTLLNVMNYRLCHITFIKIHSPLKMCLVTTLGYILIAI